jgi:hypothetical protein
VTDGSFLSHQAASQLQSGPINGKYLLAGHNAQEGSSFVPQNISTDTDLTSWANLMFPFLTNDIWNQLQQTYPDPSDTDLYSNQQERANLMYSENAFVCPSYWAVQAYPSGNAWHFQFSTPPALHSSDVDYYFPAHGRPNPHQSTFAWDFTSAFANFIVNWDPTIPAYPGAGGLTYRGTFYGVSWPAYQSNSQGNYQVDFNVSSSGSPDIEAIGDVDDYASGVQARCEVWRSIASGMTNSTASGTAGSGSSSVASRREAGMMLSALYFAIFAVILSDVFFEGSGIEILI